MPAGYYAGQRLEEPEEERGEEAEWQQLDERWGRTRCQYSGPFYSSLPNIHQRHAAAVRCDAPPAPPLLLLPTYIPSHTPYP
jgi:hypothetical protein